VKRWRKVLEISPEGLIELRASVVKPLTTGEIEDLGGEPAIDAMLANADQELFDVYQETRRISLMVVSSELQLAAHRLPPNLAVALLTLLRGLLEDLPAVWTIDEIRYRLMCGFKEKGETHDDAAKLAIEAAKGTPFGSVDTSGMKKSYTKGKRLAEQREKRERERVSRLNPQFVEKKRRMISLKIDSILWELLLRANFSELGRLHRIWSRFCDCQRSDRGPACPPARFTMASSTDGSRSRSNYSPTLKR
jgi:hypothetical protein